MSSKTHITIYHHISRFINIRMGFAGALIMGAIVWFINMGYGWWPATTAALKQAAYTFLFGGILIKILDTIASRIRNRYVAVISATLLVSVITIILVYIVHNLKGTPRPFESTLPTIIMAPPGFLALAIRKRLKD
ncbi:MAG: hypothetical protein IMY74_08330 [Bacteroidetes bacterium]|nr:hypothetical protein [Bacteroidota bacterium]MCK5766343.1 hypothetical protein [Bacteroidales bacterium]